DVCSSDLDFQLKSYRNLTKISKIIIGFPKSFPTPKYVSIFESTITQTIGGKSLSSTATATLSGKMSIINIFDLDNKPFKFYMTKDRSLAIEIGKKFKDAYGIEVVNKLEHSHYQ